MLFQKSLVILGMQLFKSKPNTRLLQILIWIAVLLLTYFSILPMEGAMKSLIYTIINTIYYAVIIYVNILLLYPIFYQNGKRIMYVILVVIFLIVVGSLRGYIIVTAYNFFLPGKPGTITTITLINYITSGILVYILSLVYRIAIEYFKLKQQTEEIMIQKSQTELNLLKSQVQPHFLFNTLNNIYYEAYREAPRTAGLIERLSDIMRYFVDETNKDIVAITTEVLFIENYISLEKIRIRHGVNVQFNKQYNSDICIPPMLLMTFVENIFKHGIDKSSHENQIDISLSQHDGYLYFETSNIIHKIDAKKRTSGFGIENLRKRLTILYGTNYELEIKTINKKFVAYLKIPII